MGDVRSAWEHWAAVVLVTSGVWQLHWLALPGVPTPPASPRLSSSCWVGLITRQPASIFILSCQTTLNLSLSVSVSNILYILVQPTTLPQVYRNNSFPLWSRHEQIVDINSVLLTYHDYKHPAPVPQMLSWQ